MLSFPFIAILRSEALAERNFTIGIVQMSCTPDPEQNMERAIAHVRDAAKQGASSFPCPSSSRRSISVSAKTRRYSSWLSRFPARN